VKRFLFAVLALAVTCAGCTTDAERAAYDDAKCKSYGATRGTAAYTNCRAQLDAARTQAAAAIAAQPVVQSPPIRVIAPPPPIPMR
jgi:hypothetical protein